MGEEHHVRGAPRIPPFLVVVSVLDQISITLLTTVEQVGLTRRLVHLISD